MATLKRKHIYPLLLLVILSGALTLTLQKWIGEVTLYQPALAERKMALHEAILRNRLPEHTSWTQLGAANGSNIRIAPVYFAEAVWRATGLSVLKTYKLIDTIALFVTFLLLFAYLHQTSSTVYALVGLLYVAAILPLTYFFAYFQPWDRPSLVCWLALLMLLRRQRLVAFTVLLAFSITIKYDTLLLPGLYLFANATRRNWRQPALRSALMCAVS